MTKALPPLPYEMLPVLRACNGPVYIHPADRKYGVLAVGGQGSGKTSVLYRLYQSDIREQNAAVVVMDPKSELAPLCLETTPPHCEKQVWYLDLGRPRFGMSPLRLDPARTLVEQASAIADNVVQAISDTAEGQVFQSSRRYLYHAVIGALTLAESHAGVPHFEDVFGLLLPDRADLRGKVVEECNKQDDLQHTANFFASVLPQELKHNRAATYGRLDPPRNKIETILTAPALRRFFSHTTDIPLRQIVEARDILIVDANMAAIGSENARVVMHFLFRLLDIEMQRQVHMPAAERPRVALICDEGSYIASKNVIEQIATHREAGLDAALGLQYLSQLGAGAQSASITEEIRKGVTNLLQSRFLFRLGEPKDAEEATRIAMSVYQSRISADLDSRELMRVTPEQALYLPVWHCLASWNAAGARAPSFIGQTYSFPKLRGGPWAAEHMRRLQARVGPYPERLPKTYEPGEAGEETKREDQAKERSSVEASNTEQVAQEAASEERGALGRGRGSAVDGGGSASHAASQDGPPQGEAAARESATGAGQPQSGPPRRKKVEPLIRRAGKEPEVKRSPVLDVVARAPTDEDPEPLFTEHPAPKSLRELAADVDIDFRLEDEVQMPSAPIGLSAEDYAILALLDRGGLALTGMLKRAIAPTVRERTFRERLEKLFKAGLIARARMIPRDAHRGRPPYVYSLTRAGLKGAQSRQPAAIPLTRRFRKIEARSHEGIRHYLHVLSWVIECHEELGRAATDNWRTPRWPHGVLPVPYTGEGRSRHRLELSDIGCQEHAAIFGVSSEQFQEIRPDAALEIHLAEPKLTFDLLLELDLTERPSYNSKKFGAYDAFLSAWWSEHPRYKALRVPPIVVWVCRTLDLALALAKEADTMLAGNVGITGSDARERYYPGREHAFFVVESDIHEGKLTALALPPLPPKVREGLDGTSTFSPRRVLLLPTELQRRARMERSMAGSERARQRSGGL